MTLHTLAWIAAVWGSLLVIFVVVLTVRGYWPKTRVQQDWRSTLTEQQQREQRDILNSVMRASERPVNVHQFAQHKPLRRDFSRRAQ